MKFNLLKVNSHGRKSLSGRWWTCKTICDICCEEIYKGVLWATPPNMQEKDYCDKCLREALLSRKEGE